VCSSDLSVATSADGAITITTQGFSDATIDAKTIVLKPQTSAGVDLTVAGIPAQVGQFKCAPGSTNPVPSKYLPGSCK
jgi:type IV pilus assembly protein PilA